MVKRDGTDIVSTDDFVAKTWFKKYLNAVLNAKEVRAGTVAMGCAYESVQERLGLHFEVTSAVIILTEGELRAALDRQREFPKYLIEGITTLELPLATDPVQRETFTFSGIPSGCIGSSPFAHAMAPMSSGACWTRGIRSTAARATLC